MELFGADLDQDTGMEAAMTKKTRLEELQEELEYARRCKDWLTAEAIEKEIAELERVLAAHQ